MRKKRFHNSPIFRVLFLASILCFLAPAALQAGSLPEAVSTPEVHRTGIHPNELPLEASVLQKPISTENPSISAPGPLARRGFTPKKEIHKTVKFPADRPPGRKKGLTFGLISLVSGFLGLIPFAGLGFSLCAIVFGFIGLKHEGFRLFSKAGIALGFFMVVVAIIIVLAILI